MKYHNILFWLLALFLVLLITAFFIHSSTGIPKADDFPMMFMFLDKWDQPQSFYDKYLLLTEQFVEHRMLAMKLTVLGVKAINGKMDINAVNTVGLIIWLGTLYVIYRAFTHVRLPLIAFLPVLLLTLHPAYGYEGLFWAATWMAFPWAIFLNLISFYFLVFRPGRSAIITAWVFAFLALFSHGNGITSFPIGLIILLTQNKWKTSVIWSVASLLGFVLFFFNYKSGGTNSGSPLENLLSHPLYVISSIGAFTGASAYFPDQELTYITSQNTPAIVFGLTLCLLTAICSIYTFWKLWSDKQSLTKELPTYPLLLFCSAIGIFVVITAVMVSCVRTDSDILRGFAARYHFYSALLIAVIYLMVISLFPRLGISRPFQIVMISFCMLYCCMQYWYQTADLANSSKIYQAGLYNFKKNNFWMVYKDSRIWERGLNQYSKNRLWPNGSDNYTLPDVDLSPDKDMLKSAELAGLPGSNSLVIENSEAD